MGKGGRDPMTGEARVPRRVAERVGGLKERWPVRASARALQAGAGREGSDDRRGQGSQAGCRAGWVLKKRSKKIWEVFFTGEKPVFLGLKI